ncbi:hypothetical protein RhiirB3_392711 [Rhizophagus irregularis]|nr:hypothetical protein RhiirB3_392711 [Rhizophagus irregularis]
MSNQQNKTCKGCHVSQKYEEFLNENGVVLKKCLKCRNKLKITRSKNKKLELDKIICYTDITETIYNFLISLNNTNEFYEGENEKLNMSFYIELSSFLDFILEKDGSSNKENHEIEIAHHIITSISEGDEYSWVYRDKNQKKNSVLLIYYCNCRIELGKRQAKHPIVDN